MKQKRNNVFIISAPSGTGKTTLVQLLLAQIPSLFFSISHTTRPPRPGERDGVEYFFIDRSRFVEMVQQDLFLEWAEVHGYYYGTSKEMIERAREQDRDLLLDIDVQGAAKIRQKIPYAVSIFIMPPSFHVLQERLLRRQKDTPDQIQYRMENARKEIQHYKEYDYVIINEDIASAFKGLASIIRSQRQKREFLEDRIVEILKSFEIGNIKPGG